MTIIKNGWAALTSLLVIAYGAEAATSKDKGHPNLTITQADFKTIRNNINQTSLAKTALSQLQAKVDATIEQPMVVPMPADAGGGFTHEQHKRNYQSLYDAALTFNLTGDTQYFEFTRAMLLEYADLYPKLGLHPKPKEQSPGKLFWQSLNEAVWLVYSIQAYDMVAASLSADDKSKIELQLLRPMANFLSHGQPNTFNKIHNHGTWAAAAVGMTGYVLGDEVLVKQALYGLSMDGSAGFLKQVEHLFSPDGYYAEGPYYQRYALMPFVLFAKAIDVNEPDRHIFEFDDGALLKAIRTTVHLSYNGLFFGINDAIKDKGINTIELVHGVAIAYQVTGDNSLLSVAREQGQTLLTGYGFAVADALEKGLEKPFKFTSMQLRDGDQGDQGALAIFRSGFEAGHQALVMKNTSQGLGHGHFDKLHWLYFDNGEEIISDYGAARFLNIEAKYGGHYLPENNKWAKQTIAHNTLVVDEISHFDGNWRQAQKSAPSILFFDATEKIKITSASVADAYSDVKFNRTMAMVSHESLEYPLILDLLKVSSSKEHQYDLPLHYQGQLISHNYDFNANAKQLVPLGNKNGYQYLWNKGSGKFNNELGKMTWLHNGRFYTYSTLGGPDQTLFFTQLGANDPYFNLTSQNALVHRVKKAKDHAFVAVLEQHGEYNGQAEYTVKANPSVKALSHTLINGIDLVSVELIDGKKIKLLLSQKGTRSSKHSLELDNKTIDWVGHYVLLEE